MSRAPVTLLVLLLSLLARASAAHACGAFFASETAQHLAIDAQRALMVVSDDAISLTLQLAANNDGQAFSWIVPVPRGPSTPTVTLGDDAVFAALDALTTPTVTIAHGNGSGGGLCGSDAKAGALEDVRGGVQHFGGADLGPYTYDILGSSDPSALSAWLTEHGYVVPSAFAEVVTPYTERSVFIAVRLSAGAASDGATTKPLTITWQREFGSGLGYAFGLSRLSSAEVQPLLLWVLADKRQRVANYGSTELREVAATMRDEGLEYDAAVASLTADAGGRLVVTEFARDLRNLDLPAALSALVGEQSFYLTRLYAAVPVADIEDLVITFAANAPEVEPAVTVSLGGSAGPVLASVLALFWLRRRA